MKYYSFHIDDSGAIEYSDYKLINGVKTLFGNIYNDPEFNQLNDILHSNNDYVVTNRALELWKTCNIAEHEIHPAVIKKVKRILGPLGIPTNHRYNQVELISENNISSYKWIDYSKSRILKIKNEILTDHLIQSYDEMTDIWEDNNRTRSMTQEIYQDSSLSIKQKETKINKIETMYWSTELIAFGNLFNDDIDFFRIPHFSFGTYVSERFKKLMETNNITDIGFIDNKDRLGIPWRKHYPIINFKMNTYR